jgi:hypothetical protein
MLEESNPLYEKLVQYLAQNYYNLFFSSKGLNDVPCVVRFFNPNWFLKKIIITYRNILTKYPIGEP